MDHPVVMGGFSGRRVLHLRLDEELQDVVVLLALVDGAAVSGAAAAALGTQDQAAVVEAALGGLIHDVEPGPRLHHAAHAVLALVLLLQVLQPEHDNKKKRRGLGRVGVSTESHLTLYLVRRLSHFLAICSEVSLPSRPRPFRMVLGHVHGGQPRGRPSTCSQR